MFKEYATSYYNTNSNFVIHNTLPILFKLEQTKACWSILCISPYYKIYSE